MKRLLLGAVLLMVVLPGRCGAQAPAGSAAQGVLSAFMYYTDLRLSSVQQSLEILAATNEARSGHWDRMKDLLGVYQATETGLIVWYVRPDGSYYTVEKGLMDVTLKDRAYFPDLMAGGKIIGSLVVSKATGQRSAVVAVPVREGKKVVGAIGASVFLEMLSEQIDAMLDFGPDMGFWALSPDGLTTLHRKTDRHFLDPRTLGSETLKTATEEMLAGTSGEVTYLFDNQTKTAVYRTSPLTLWRFVISTGAGAAK